MTVPLSRDATAGILGVDVQHRGLFCRADPQCSERFKVAGHELTTRAAAMREFHEVAAHGYRHQVVRSSKWSYASGKSNG